MKPRHEGRGDADHLTAYFNLDLAQIRGYGLGDDAEALLQALALYKIRCFLDGSLRLRTACDLELVNPEKMITRPEEYILPSLAGLGKALPGLIEACKADLGEVITIEFAQATKKTKKAKD